MKTTWTQNHSIANRQLFNFSRNAWPEVIKHAANFGHQQDGYDQSYLTDVIILFKVIVSLFCKKMITKNITKYSSNCNVRMY